MLMTTCVFSRILSLGHVMQQGQRAKSTGACRAAWQVALVYLLVGLTWVLLSGHLVGAWVGDDVAALVLMETYKGYAFITATAVLIFALVQFHVSRLLQAQARRRESERQFDNTFEYAVTGMALLSTDLKFLRANPVMCDMLGYTEAELQKLAVPDIMHPADRDDRVRHLLAMVGDGAPPQQTEVRHVRKDGQAVWVLVKSTLQRDAAGKPLYFVAQSVDVTPLHQAEEQARQQQMELARAARLISLGEVSSTLAHELNQPLGAILHYGETCQDMLRHNGKASRGSLTEAMDDVVRQAQRAKQIVQRVRAAARKQTPRAVPVDASQAVRDALASLRPQLDRYRVPCRLKLADGLPGVAADPVQIGQVLVNLVTNAVDAVAHEPADARWVELRTWLHEGRVWIGVRDGGHGVTQESAERLFESFFTTKADGLGLGLAISKSIVEAHGGRLTMQRGECWTEFEFFLLPVTEAAWLMADPTSG